MRRASFWVTLIALLVGIFATLAMFSGNEHAAIFAQHGEGVYARSGQAQAVAPMQVAAVPIGEVKSVSSGKVTVNGDPRNPAWKIEGKWESTSEDARRAAYLQAQEEIVNFLRSQDPPVKWVPPVSFISDRQKKIVAGKPEEETKDFAEIGTMRRLVLEVTLPTDARKEIWRHESESHARQRMLFLAKILAGLVSVLAATAGYLQLDEATKGFYTGWLRLAAAGLLGAAAIVLALLA